jgi:flagellar hook-associated protein FlgK
MASRAMQAQMTGVTVSEQNLTSVSTTGYTRQTVDIQTSLELATSVGDEGAGAGVVAIQPAVNSVLNSQIVTRESPASDWTAQ